MVLPRTQSWGWLSLGHSLCLSMLADLNRKFANGAVSRQLADESLSKLFLRRWRGWKRPT